MVSLLQVDNTKGEIAICIFIEQVSHLKMVPRFMLRIMAKKRSESGLVQVLSRLKKLVRFKEALLPVEVSFFGKAAEMKRKTKLNIQVKCYSGKL